jgi:hypothetical protein
MPDRCLVWSNSSPARLSPANVDPMRTGSSSSGSSVGAYCKHVDRPSAVGVQLPSLSLKPAVEATSPKPQPPTHSRPSRAAFLCNPLLCK